MPNGTHAWLWKGSSFEPSTSLPITDRGFRYGMSVFESIRVHNQSPLFLDDHLAVLQSACRAAGLLTPPSGALAASSSILRTLPDGFARIYVTAGDGPVTAPLDTCRVLIFAEPRDPIPASAYHRGYDLAIHSTPYAPLFSGLKTGNYWTNLRAFNAGVANHCNETLLISPDNLVISASMANVFVVSGKQMLTPIAYPESPDFSGTCRPGVVREWVMRTFQATAGAAFIRRDELDTATEIFLTSSWLGIMPAASIQGRPLKHKIGRQVLEAYRREFGIPC